MNLSISLIGIVFLLVVLMCTSTADAAAFLANHHKGGPLIRHGASVRTKAPFSPTNQEPLQMLPESTEAMASASAAALSSQYNNLLLATIDSDIASVPDNEFAPIFAGGILVMFGGVLSALIVGLILEKRDLYANVIADSYAQGAEDETFWKGLSEEEKKKTQELLAKLKASKEGGGDPAPAMVKEAKQELKSKEAQHSDVSPPPTAREGLSQQEPVEQDKDAGMFSDY